MITEEQAKTKWCPKVRILATIKGFDNEANTTHLAITAFNRDEAGFFGKEAFCIASSCMKWPQCSEAWADMELKAHKRKEQKGVGGKNGH
ncbi:hypothetical protein KAR91_77210 [Candidatus Pacearchaeota archaeon]|nr:hypothetical protein [Candidatus Pacearchaeota archaeon]